MVREERVTARRQLGDDVDVFKSRSAYVIASASCRGSRGSCGLLPTAMMDVTFRDKYLRKAKTCSKTDTRTQDPRVTCFSLHQYTSYGR